MLAHMYNHQEITVDHYIQKNPRVALTPPGGVLIAAIMKHDHKRIQQKIGFTTPCSCSL
jgi:hypothetical protein